MNELFVPHELKTIEVDVDKKIFRINGKDFGKDCTGFNISCDPGKWDIRIDVDATVRYVGYDKKGIKRSDHTYERHGQ